MADNPTKILFRSHYGDDKKPAVILITDLFPTEAHREMHLAIPLSAFEGRLYDKKGKLSEDDAVRMAVFEPPELNFIKETLTTACSVIGKAKNPTEMQMKFFEVDRDPYGYKKTNKNTNARFKFESKDEKIDMIIRYETADDDPTDSIHSATKEAKLFFRKVISNIQRYLHILEKREMAKKEAEEKANT